nr:MAG TPA: hypothetical protein [Caudoviricetes sp.]
MLKISFEANTAHDLHEQIKTYLSEFHVSEPKTIPTEVINPANITPDPAQNIVVEPVVNAPVEQPSVQPEPTVSTVAPTVPVAEPTPPVSPAVPVAPVKEYTLEEIQVAMQPLMDAGKIDQIITLLQRYGVSSLPEITKDRYGELITDLRALGARL